MTEMSEKKAEPAQRILLIEDEPGDAELIRRFLESAAPGHYRLERVESLAAARDTLAGQTPALILLDLTLPDSSGLETVRSVHHLAPTTPLVVLTGHDDPDFALSTLAAGAQDYLVKGSFGSDGLLRAVRHAAVRAQLEERLIESERRQQALLAAVPDIMVEVDSEKNYTWANPAGFNFFGDDLIGRPAADFFIGEQKTYAQVQPLFDGSEEVIYVESRQRRRDGQVRLLAWWCRVLKDKQGRVTGALSTGRDISEQRKLEEQLRQAQKMESVGTLAGGIAHDFNNLLTAIIGYGQITLLAMAADDPQRANIEQILAAAKRGAHLTQGLLLFSRKQAGDRKPVDLNEVIRRVESFLQRVIGEDIDFKVVLCDRELFLLADEHQLEQVLINLATNARDAMPAGGSFDISTVVVDLDREFISNHGCGEPGPHAVITVSDSGLGMDPPTQARIFEPFFTTKEVGRGTGLGLAVVYGIVQQHEGFVNLYSEQGKGTTFRIYLPLLSRADSRSQTGTGDGKPYPPGGTETILIAEDDEAIRTLTRSVLERFGYRVIEAADGEEAVARFRESRERIDLLLFDLIMPRLNGKEAFDEISRLKPGIKGIFASGYAPELLRQKVTLDNGTPLIYKPMSIRDLLGKVRQVLDGGS